MCHITSAGIVPERIVDIIIIGGGIGGLTLALAAHAAQAGDRIRVFEAAPEIRPLGVGINLGPHAVKELSALGLREGARGGRLPAAGLCLLHPPRPAGLPRAVGTWQPAINGRTSPSTAPTCTRCCWRPCGSGSGRQSFITGQPLRRRRAGAMRGVTARFVGPDGARCEPQRGDVVIACDGIHSAVRAQFYPDEGPFAYRGINLWRGVTRMQPYLTGRSIARIGARALDADHLSDPRQYRRRRTTSSSTGWRRSSARSRCRSTGTSRAGSRTSSGLSRLELRLARRRRP